MSNAFTDNHTAVVYHELLEDEVISQWLREKLVALGLNPACVINNVRKYTGELQGFAYVYFADTKAFNVLIGKNPDGTERVEEVHDEFNFASTSKSWADIDEEEQKHTKRVPLPPLVEMDDKITGINPADISKSKIEYKRKTLYCRSRPGINMESVSKFFSQFCPRHVIGGRVYPNIRGGSARLEVEFDDSTKAAFAHFMCRVAHIDKETFTFKSLDEIQNRR